jgi:hypothetical protein
LFPAVPDTRDRKRTAGKALRSFALRRQARDTWLQRLASLNGALGLVSSAVANQASAHRRYYREAVARALLLAEMPPRQVATLIALCKDVDHARRLQILIGSVVASLVHAS